MNDHRPGCLIWIASATFLSAGMLLIGVSHAAAQDKSAIPPVAVYRAMLDANRQSGWVQFRNYDGTQWIYFTALQTMHCRLKEIRYSLNSQALDKQFPLTECNLQNPFALPPDAGIDDIAIRLGPGTAKTVAVQVVWDDGTESDIAVYEPCKDVGDQSCAWPLD
jgi:hypothetical protein